MNQDIRRELISKNLGIKPINHGQVHAFQIAIPDARKQTISLEQRQAIENILLSHQSNLVSLILRRTNAYADEDIEYELVYGAAWLQISQELEIEKVWAWVFDLTDEQMLATIAEMESLTEPSRGITISDEIDSNIASLIDQKIQLSTDSIKNLITSLFTGIRNDLGEQLKVLNYKIDHFSSENSVGGLEGILARLDTIQQQLTSPQNGSGVKPLENQINLLNASNQEIEAALRQVNTQGRQIDAVLKAVQYWRQSKQITWKNLELSARASTKSPDKIEGFARKTYDRLQAVAFIPEHDTAD